MAASPKGSISFLITGDEEDIAVNGTIKLLQWAAARGEKFDHCVLGEPSNVETLGDCIKIGRRGSQSGTLYVDGVQGHVAYPHRAANPVPDISRLIVALSDEPLDHGSAQFQASNLEFTSVDVGNTASNVIPGQARAKFNIRFNDLHTQETLRELVEQRLAKAAGNRIRARIVWEPSNANVFVTKPGAFTDLAVAAIEEVTGRKPELSTSGGTSDARFISQLLPGDRVRPGRPDHAPDRRAHAGRRSGEADRRSIAGYWTGISREGCLSRPSHPLDCAGSIAQSGGTRHRRFNNPPAPDRAPPAARPGRRRRGCGRQALRRDRRRSSGPRRPRPASPPSSAPGCAGTSAPRSRC